MPPLAVILSVVDDIAHIDEERSIWHLFQACFDCVAPDRIVCGLGITENKNLEVIQVLWCRSEYLPIAGFLSCRQPVFIIRIGAKSAEVGRIHVRGGKTILAAVEKALNIKAGHTTENQAFTLETVACLGACGLSPIVQVNDDTHGRVTVDAVPNILARYQ